MKFDLLLLATLKSLVFHALVRSITEYNWFENGIVSGFISKFNILGKSIKKQECRMRRNICILNRDR